MISVPSKLVTTVLKTVWKWKNVCKYIVVPKCSYIVPVTHVYLL